MGKFAPNPKPVRFWVNLNVEQWMDHTRNICKNTRNCVKKLSSVIEWNRCDCKHLLRTRGKYFEYEEVLSKMERDASSLHTNVWIWWNATRIIFSSSNLRLWSMNSLFFTRNQKTICAQTTPLKRPHLAKKKISLFSSCDSEISRIRVQIVGSSAILPRPSNYFLFPEFKKMALVKSI